MFIEGERSKRFLLAPAERNEAVSRTGPETLRSAGARVVLATDIYKYLALLEPEYYLVVA
jgi:hypothetical protein